jgi:hypothetical protein
MKKIFQIITLISIGVLLNSCYYDDAYIEHELDGGEIPDVVSFATDIQPLFSTCTGCHKGSYPEPDLRIGYAYSSLVPEYVTAGNSANSVLYNYLPGNGHHDVGFEMNTAQIALIKAWIDQGAANN